MSRLPSRSFGLFAVGMILLGAACSGSSEKGSGDTVAEVAANPTKIVYYAIPG